MNRWIEHFIVIPLRWLRLHWKAWRDQQQRCKVCGYRDKFDFHVDDETWARVVPKKYQNRVVCLACFDDFATKREIDYSTSLKELYFAGDSGRVEISVRAKR